MPRPIRGFMTVEDVILQGEIAVNVFSFPAKHTTVIHP